VITLSVGLGAVQDAGGSSRASGRDDREPPVRRTRHRGRLLWSRRWVSAALCVGLLEGSARRCPASLR